MRTLPLLLLAVACGPGQEGPSTRTDREGAPTSITVESTAFAEGKTIPDRFTCQGEDVSPPLRWSGLPEGAASLAVVVDDPDAPGGTFVHWAVWGIDPGTDGLEAGSVPEGVGEARNDFGTSGYRGPCPPVGDTPHRYRFRVLALTGDPGLSGGTEAAGAVQALEAAAVAEGILTGRFGR